MGYFGREVEHGLAICWLAICWLAICWLAAGVGLAGCVSDGQDSAEPGPAERGVHFRMEAFSSFERIEGLLQFDDPDGTIYSMTSARLAVAGVALELPFGTKCADVDLAGSPRLRCAGAAVRLRGPWVVDLVSGQTTPDLSEVTVPAVDYGEVRLQVEPARLDDPVLADDDALVDRTIIGLADFEFEDSVRQLQLAFRFRKTTPVSVDHELEDADTVVLQIDIAPWLARIPVTACVMNGHILAHDDRVTVDGNPLSGACSEALYDYRSNFDRSVRVRMQ